MKDENGLERATCLTHLPDDVEYTSPDGVFMKGMIMKMKDTTVYQHSHEYAHTSIVARGSVRVFVEGEGKSTVYHAPAFIHVPAKRKHEFISLEDNTAVYCVHNIQEYTLFSGKPLVHEENLGRI